MPTPFARARRLLSAMPSCDRQRSDSASSTCSQIAYTCVLAYSLGKTASCTAHKSESILSHEHTRRRHHPPHPRGHQPIPVSGHRAGLGVRHGLGRLAGNGSSSSGKLFFRAVCESTPAAKPAFYFDVASARSAQHSSHASTARSVAAGISGAIA